MIASLFVDDQFLRQPLGGVGVAAIVLDRISIFLPATVEPFCSM